MGEEGRDVVRRGEPSEDRKVVRESLGILAAGLLWAGLTLLPERMQTKILFKDRRR